MRGEIHVAVRGKGDSYNTLYFVTFTKKALEFLSHVMQGRTTAHGVIVLVDFNLTEIVIFI